MDDKKMCSYCGRHYPAKTMTPMYEKDKEGYNCYCEDCLPTVKKNMSTLHYYHLFSFGKKGEV